MIALRHRSRRRWLFAPVVAALVLAGCGGGGGGGASSPEASAPSTGSPSGAPASAGADVAIRGFAYHGATVTVSPGTKVTWTNRDRVDHTVTADDASFDLGSLSPGQTRSHVFVKPGTYPYYCQFHPYMHGRVVVK